MKVVLHALNVLQSLLELVRVGVFVYNPTAKCSLTSILCPIIPINTVRHVRQVSVHNNLLCCQVESRVRTQPRRISSTS